MAKIYSYVLRIDDGAAPNPYWGTCTLTICKPDIRRTAEVGDWIVGTGSKNSRLRDGNVHDRSNCVVYAMKVTSKMSLKKYNEYCMEHLPNKIPRWISRDFRIRMGDCIYDFPKGKPVLRKSVHQEEDVPRDLRGMFSLLSTHFYYFGEEARLLPADLQYIIRRGQKHLVFEDDMTLRLFEKWIAKLKKNRINAEPQLRFKFDPLSSSAVKC